MAFKYKNFYDWWENGTRFEEREPHCFAKDFPSDAWLAKEAWQAAKETNNNAVLKCLSCMSLCRGFPKYGYCKGYVKNDL